MSNKMIIDASHPEETRVVVLRGNRVEEFDFESANKKPLRGNIYLAKVTRVEPSLQAAFIEYGGNRHGFLAFSEIHPDYYQIPVADRQALLEEEARSHREDEDEPNGERRSRRRRPRAQEAARHGDARVSGPVVHDGEPSAPDEGAPDDSVAAEASEPLFGDADETTVDGFASVDSDAPSDEMAPRVELGQPPIVEGLSPDEDGPTIEIERQAARDEAALSVADEAEPQHEAHHDHSDDEEEAHDEVTTLGGEGEGDEPVRNVRPRADDEDEPVESIGGDAMDEAPRRASRPRRHYKIQEVIKRRQVLLVQVVKEERGNKGAALTTYLSLAGRYSVLMPNTARGGGISRKITNAQDRSRLKSIARSSTCPRAWA